MQNTLIDNSAQLQMQQTLRECLSLNGIHTVQIATGYWDLLGMALVLDELRTFLQKEGTKLQLLIGKDPFVYANQVVNPKYKNKQYPNDYIRTDIEELDLADEACKQVVELLMKYCSGDSPKIEIHIFKRNENDESQFLHSKCYIFETPDEACAVIGSSNFTKKGLEGNSELNYVETDYLRVLADSAPNGKQKSFRTWFDEKWHLSEPWNKEFLEQVLEPTPIAKKVKEEVEEQEQANVLTPYETYIRVLADRFGTLADPNIEGVLKSYLPKSYRAMKYQLDAAALCYQVMKQHGGFLLGDVVGLGKTITGVLLLKYYLDVAEQEGRQRKALIIVPPAIKSAWLRTITAFDNDRDDKILPYVDFCTTGSIGKLMEGAEDEVDDSTGEFEDELKHELYGLILIDESHNFRNNATKMYNSLNDLIEEIGLQVGVYPYIGCISATLQNNRPEDLRNQIYLFQRKPSESTLAVEGHNLQYFFTNVCARYEEIIQQHPTGEDEKKANKEALIYLSKEIHDKVLAELLVRRTRTDVKKDYKEDLKFPDIVGPEKLEYKLNERLATLFDDTMDWIAPSREYLQTGGPYINYYRYRATEYLKADLQKRYTGKNMSPEKSATRLARIMQILLVKRLESSFTAFRESLENLYKYTQNMIQMWEDNCIFICPQININAELNIEKKSKRADDTLYTYEMCYADIRKKIERLDKEKRNEKKQNAEYRRSDFDPNYIVCLQEDAKLIAELVKRWDKEHYDPKLDKFKKELSKTLFDATNNQPHKLVIFSEALATVDEIAEAAENNDYRVLKITSANRDEKEEIIRANFDANYEKEPADDYDIIVTTEVLSEGVNLHRANTILNYDTPWNSTRLIQRIGRVNRIGSTADKVFVYNFYPSAEGDQQINLVQRAFTKLQSFHTLFGEDSKVFSEEEELAQVDYKKLTDGPETPYSKYIACLQQYRADHPERFEYIQSLEAPIVSALNAEQQESLYVVKTDGNEAGSIYVRVDDEGAKVIPCLEMFEHCECAENAEGITMDSNEEKDKAAIQEYKTHMARIFRSANTTNRTIIKAKEAIRTWIALPGISIDAKQRLSIASRIIGKGDIAIAKKVVKMAERIADPQQDLFNFNIDDVNQIVMTELAALNQKMVERFGEPYIYLNTNKVNN